MKLKEARSLGALLEGAAGRVPFLEGVGKGHSLWQHPWIVGKSHGPAFRIPRGEGERGLLLVTVEWRPQSRKGNWYLIGVSEEDLATAEIELHELSDDGHALLWKYVPRKQDGKNEERVRLFSEKYPECRVSIKVPTIDAEVPVFIEQIEDVVADRRRVDDLIPLQGDTSSELSPEEETQFEEGEMRRRFGVHRYREQRLRAAKIADVLQRTGVLRCEVPGCGFDFAATYGKLGEGFAHVHHKVPLASLEGTRRTTLSELAVVCPNCHAMIHRGGTSRALDKILLPGRRHG